MAQAIRVVDYGWVEAAALGVTFDGVTDDYAAMQRAVERLDSGTKLILGQGTAMLSASVECIDLPGITIDGAGAGQALNLDYGTRFRMQGNFPAFKLGDTSGITVNKNPVHTTLRNFQIYGTSTGTSQHGIVIAATEAASYQASFNVLEGLTIWNCGGTGIKFADNAWDNVVKHCQIYANDGHGIAVYDEGNANTFFANYVQSNGGDGYYFEGTNYNSNIIGGEASGNTGWGVNINDLATRAVQVNGLYMENNLAGQLQNKGNTTFLTNCLAMQHGVTVGYGTKDIIRWSGNRGKIDGLFMAGGGLSTPNEDCRWAINADDSLGLSIRNVSYGATAASGDLSHVGATELIFEDHSHRVGPSLTVYDPLATGGTTNFSIDTPAGSNFAQLLLKHAGTTKWQISKDASNNFLLRNINGDSLIKAKDATQRLFTAALGSAPTDGDIPTSFISFYLDESGHNLNVRVRYADGTTLKTGTLALV